MTDTTPDPDLQRIIEDMAPPEGREQPMPTMVVCQACGADMGVRFGDSFSPGDDVCGSCRRLYPPSLLKASGDPFFYALRLTSGEVLFFESCSIDGNWIHLTGITTGDQRSNPVAPFERGLDVHITQIVWCADAPDGS